MRRFRAIGVVVVLFLLFTAVPGAVGYYTDWLWFREVGFQSVFVTELLAKVGLFAGVAIVASILPRLPGLSGRSAPRPVAPVANVLAAPSPAMAYPVTPPPAAVALPLQQAPENFDRNPTAPRAHHRRARAVNTKPVEPAIRSARHASLRFGRIAGQDAERIADTRSSRELADAGENLHARRAYLTQPDTSDQVGSYSTQGRPPESGRRPSDQILSEYRASRLAYERQLRNYERALAEYDAKKVDRPFRSTYPATKAAPTYDSFQWRP